MNAHDSWLRNEGMSIYQIADRLGISPARVRQIEMSALAKLRRRPWLLRQFIGLNAHLGDSSYEVAIRHTTCASTSHLDTITATPAPKEGQPR